MSKIYYKNKIDELLRFKNSEDGASPNYIVAYASRFNIQTLTKNPVKCFLCKETIAPLQSYRSFGALRGKSVRGKIVKTTTWRKTCGSCDQVKEIKIAWNKKVNKNKGGEHGSSN